VVSLGIADGQKATARVSGGGEEVLVPGIFRSTAAPLDYDESIPRRWNFSGGMLRLSMHDERLTVSGSPDKKRHQPLQVWRDSSTALRLFGDVANARLVLEFDGEAKPLPPFVSRFGTLGG
jgi:hypothetical protein